MPIVHSHQAAPSAVADFAKDIGYMQEKSRQLSEQRSYSNRMAEINQQYENQSALSKQSAVQRAYLTNQESVLREDFAEKQQQLGLKSMAAELEAKGDYQSSIMAEQFNNQYDKSLVKEKLKKEASGFTSSQSQELRKKEIQQKMEKIKTAEHLTPEEKQEALRPFERQLQTMIPDKEPENYLKPNTVYTDKSGNEWSINKDGEKSLLRDSSGRTEKQIIDTQEDDKLKKQREHANALADKKNATTLEVANISASTKVPPGDKQATAKKDKIEKDRAKTVTVLRSQMNTSIATNKAAIIAAANDVERYEDKAIVLKNKIEQFYSTNAQTDGKLKESDNGEYQGMVKSLQRIQGQIEKNKQELQTIQARSVSALLNQRGKLAAKGDKIAARALIADAKKGNMEAKAIIDKIVANKKIAAQQAAGNDTALTDIVKQYGF